MKSSRKAILRQVLTTLASGTSYLLMGNVIAWTSHVMIILKEKTEEIPISEMESAKLGAVFYAGNCLSPLPTAYIMEKIGRKFTLCIASMLPLVAWAILVSTKNTSLLYITRFIFGIWAGTVVTIVPVYISEIAEPELRGALVCSLTLMLYFGMVIEYLIGPYMTYSHMAITSGCLTSLFYITLWLIPTSPYWLLAKGRRDRAVRVLIWLRAKKVPQAVMEEVTMIENYIKTAGELKLFKAFWRKPIINVFGIIYGFSVLQRLTGGTVLTTYTYAVLPKSYLGDVKTFNIYREILLVGCMFLVGNLISVILTDIIGRRPLLIVSSVGTGVATFCLGTLTFIDIVSESALNEKRIGSIILFMVYGLFYSVGLGPLQTLIVGETFPDPVRGLSSGLICVTIAVLAVVLNLIFLPIKDTFGVYFNYWIYCLACTIETFYILYFLAETKAKSLDKVYNEFSKNEIRISDGRTQITEQTIRNTSKRKWTFS